MEWTKILFMYPLTSLYDIDFKAGCLEPSLCKLSNTATVGILTFVSRIPCSVELRAGQVKDLCKHLSIGNC